jgi:TRAP-type transport system small permease protein
MLNSVERIIGLVAGALLLFLLLLTFSDVVARNLLNRPIAGATELVEIALVGVTFTLYPLVAYQRKHIVVDLLDDFMPQLVRRIQAAVAGLAGALLFGIMSWRLALRGMRLDMYGEVTPYLRLPLSPTYYFMSFLAAVTTMAFLITVYTGFRDGSGPAHDSERTER